MDLLSKTGHSETRLCQSQVCAPGLVTYLPEPQPPHLENGDMTVLNPKRDCELTGDNTHRTLGTVRKLIIKVPGTSRVAQQLGQCTSNVESVGSNPTRGTKICTHKKPIYASSDSYTTL